MEASLKHITGSLAPVSRGLLAAQPDSTLCALARRGHNGAYAALYARYQAPISRFVSQILGHGRTEDAADVTQEVFAAAFSAMAGRDRDVPFKPWLYKIARNRSIDHLRAKRPVTADLDSEMFASADTPASRAEQREELNLVVTAIESLPVRQREALVLRELGGLSHDEIANTLETTVPSVKQLLTRGRASVNKQANLEGNRGKRQLSKSLAAIYPPIPIVGGWSSLAGTLGLAGAGAGVVGKVAAIALVVGAIGGAAAGVQQISTGLDASGGERSAITRGAAAPGVGDDGSHTAIADDRAATEGKQRDSKSSKDNTTSASDDTAGSGAGGPDTGGSSGDSPSRGDADRGGPAPVGAPNVGAPDVGGTVEETTGQVEDTVGGTSPTLGNAVEETLDAIPNVGGTVGDVVETLPKVEGPKLPALAP